MSIEEITLSQLKATGRKLMTQREWSSSSLIALGGSLAAEINSVSSLSGPQKQTLVVLAIKDLVKESVKGSTAELAKAQHLLQIADDVLPACLNLAVSAARGGLDLKKIDLKKVQKTCWTVLPSLLSLCIPKEQMTQISAVAGFPEAKSLTVENVAAVSAALASSEPEPVKEKEETKTLQYTNPSLSIRTVIPEEKEEKQEEETEEKEKKENEEKEKEKEESQT